jgi:hypothetical protein
MEGEGVGSDEGYHRSGGDVALGEPEARAEEAGEGEVCVRLAKRVARHDGVALLRCVRVRDTSAGER